MKILLQANSEIIEREGAGNNPLQTIARFVFADNQPDGNKRIVEYDQFEGIISSAIGMPVKIRLTEAGVEAHENSVPIGVITKMESLKINDDHYQLIAEATLWSEEYPKEIAWLKKAYSEGKAPGISYELVYKESEVTESGFTKLKNIITGAATFVKVPAFGKRTPLLALASFTENPEEFLKTITKDEANGLIALAEQLKEGNSTIKGGKKMDEKELEALKAKAALADQLTADAASKETQIADLTAALTAKDGEITTLTGKITDMEASAQLEARVGQFTAAGFALEAEAELATKRKSLIASFSDEQYTGYLADLVSTRDAAKKGVPASASLRARATIDAPKLEVQEMDMQSLRQGLRSLSRPNQTE